MSFQTLCGLAAIADKVQVTVIKVTDTTFQAILAPSLKLAAKYPQLANPLQVLATADEMDAEVSKALTTYVPMLQEATSNLAQIQEALDQAKKDAKAKPAVKVPAAIAKGTVTTNGAKPTTPMLQAPPDLFSSSDPSSSGPTSTGSTSSSPVNLDEDDETLLPELEE